MKLLSLKALNTINLSLNNKLIDPAQLIWENSQPDHHMPCAYPIEQAPYELEVLTNNIPADSTIQGVTKNGDVLFSGKLNTETTIVRCKLSNTKSELFKGNIFWEVTSSAGDKTNIGNTFIEIYWIAIHQIDPFLRRRGLPVEDLNAVFDSEQDIEFDKQVFLDEEDRGITGVDQIVRQVFNYNPPRYDIMSGAPHFISRANWDNITLHYKAYQAAKNIANSTLNCYDAAAVVQYLLKLASIGTKYGYMQPFGYLKLTNLIGRGQCNNPFYGSSRSIGQPVIDPLSPKRTAFGNHAFVLLTPAMKVADACAGPHIGNETKQEYVASAVDRNCPNPSYNGTANNITAYAGVTSNNLIKSVVDLNDIPVTNNFISKMNFQKNNVAWFSNKAVAVAWPSPKQFLKGEWQELHDEIAPGSEEVLKIWMLEKSGHMVMVKLYVVSGDNDLSFNRFISLGSLTQNAETLYEPGPQDLGNYSAVLNTENSKQCFWLFHNIVFDIYSTDPDIDTVGIAQAYYKLAAEQSIEKDSLNLPNTNLNLSNITAKKGERLSIALASDENQMTESILIDDTLQLAAEQNDKLLLDTKHTGVTELEILVIDKRTLLVKSEKITIEVTD